jgi:hypothetical protein
MGGKKKKAAKEVRNTGSWSKHALIESITKINSQEAAPEVKPPPPVIKENW